MVNWSLAGIRNALPSNTHIVDFTDAGAISDGITANDMAFQKLVDTVKTPVTIYFPKGKYYFTKPMVLRQNVTIMGVSNDSTILNFKLDTTDALIKIFGSATNITSEVVSGLNKDNQIIQVFDPEKFAAGDYIIIKEDDLQLITSSWAKGTTGQIIKIDSIAGQDLYLASPLRRNYSGGNATVTKLNMVQHSSIENLKIVRLDTNTAQSSNILFEYAANCMVKCVESDNCNFAHIELDNSTNIEISGCYIHNAFQYGDGGEGYGVAAQNTSGECLITDNIFDSLRHPMLMQAGANGNVFSYNYAIHPIWAEAGFPVDAAGSIVLHGNYPYANLLEGNVVQNIVIDNSHGENGPYNTFYRNRAELYGFVMSLNAGNSENFVGNEITGKGFLKGNFVITGLDEYEYGNNLNNTIVPRGTCSISTSSLYLSGPPAYYHDNSSWPPIGPPSVFNSDTIAAENRYNKGFYTPCSAATSVDGNDTSNTGITPILTHYASLTAYPNPTESIVQLHFQNSSQLYIQEINVLSPLGKILFKVNDGNEVNLMSLPDGIYFLRVRFSDNEQATVKVLKQGQ